MRYFIYARKSTEDEDRQILSIEAQLVELKEFAAKEKLEIADSFFESKTAKEPGRKIFDEMLARIEQGQADGILSWHPDRLARNSVDGGKIIHLVDRGTIKALKFPCFWFEPTPQGLFMLNIAFGQSKYFVDNLRENVKRGLRQKLRNGVWPSFAPVGYLNNARTRGIDVDSTKSAKIKKVFELYATGQYSLLSLVNWCEAHGLTGGYHRKLSVNAVFSVLQNIFYLGLMRYKGEVFEGTHEPLISKQLFEKVQKVRNARARTRKKLHRDFAFTGLMKCPCGCSITAETQKSHNYYRCTKKRGECSEKHFLHEEELEIQIKSYLQTIALNDQDQEKIMTELDKDEKTAKEQAQTNVQNLKSELENINQQLEKLLDVYLCETISTDEYTSRKQKILTRKLELNEKVKDFEHNNWTWVEPAREFILSLNKADNLLLNSEKSELATFLKNIGSNRILQNRQLLFDYEIPYDLVAEIGDRERKNLTIPFWCCILKIA